jgi:hypothetical protein
LQVSAGKVETFEITIDGVLNGQVSDIGSDTLAPQGRNGQVTSTYKTRPNFDPTQVNPQVAAVRLPTWHNSIGGHSDGQLKRAG